jgi:hypothetical protein
VVPVFAVLAAMAVWSIPASSIDHRRARGGEPIGPNRSDDYSERAPSGLSIPVTCRPPLVHAGCTIPFHFANPPLLPLVLRPIHKIHKAAPRCWSTAGARIALSAGNPRRCGFRRHTGRSTAKKAKFRGTNARSAGSMFYFDGAER